jgi:7-keto-8-aminopelargonate synthetase-like enzyme
MAKIKHNNYLDVVDNVFSAAKNKGIMHIHSEEKKFNGKEFTIRGKQLKNFGTCGYLGLEMHPNLIEGAIDLTKKFGTQLSMSRAYIKPLYIQELEELISTIFNGNKAICYTSTSTAHISVIATIIKSDDLIILDQQVHFSVQFPCRNMQLSGTTVKMVRHSDYDMLEEMLKKEANNYNRIWYMADGVYSMYGDLPDTNKLKALMEKYPKLHLYFDDAHGMGWGGKNGAGLIFDRLGVSERVVLISTLAKGFGCVGGTAIFSDKETHRKVDVFGGPLSYSHPLSPANVGAAIASAKIHLSGEIYQYQNELRELLVHMNKRILEKNLPNISSPDSPIYFIGVGYNKVARNLVDRILKEGIYVNTSTFPTVPNDKAGLRFTITRHNTKADIDELADAIGYHFPKAIEEENDRVERVYEKFNFTYTPEHKTENEIKEGTELITEEYNTINDIDPELWDSVMKDRGNITHSGMKCMEEIFSGNDEPENNWAFHYLLIKDHKGKLLCATFFTGIICKDDMLAPANVSKKIEEERKLDPYYLCSQTLAMGSMFSEGNYLYLDTNHPKWQTAISLLFTFVGKIKKETKADVVVFRDFEEDNIFNKILEDEGYVKLNMPNSNMVQNPKWETTNDLLAMIDSRKKRDNIKQYALRHVDKFNITIKDSISDIEAQQYFKLFCNVKDANFAFNFFKYPEKIASILSKYADWEFIDIRLKGGKDPIACIWCFKGENHYSPIIMGLNYDYLESHHIYKQAVFQMVKRANDLNKATAYLGFSADFEKQKYLAITKPTYAFIKVDDTYNLELIESYSNINEIVNS